MRETLHNEANFGATVHIKSPAPVLFLEDFDHLAEYIVCQPGYIVIEVHGGVDFIEAQKTLLGLEAGGLIITSHYGCNDHGERKLFKIGTVNVSEHGTTYMLETVPANWRSTFSTIEVEMYHTTESHKLRTHDELRRRQEDPTLASASETPTHSAPHPTSTSTSDVNKLDLKHSLTDKKLLPDGSPVQITCKNCSTTGSIDFSFVSFKVDIDPVDIATGPIEIGDFFDGGEVQVVANGMGAHVELTTNVSLETGDYNLNLFELPLLFAVAIKGFGSAGLLYAPDININYSINGSFEFTYGFEIAVPDNSKLFLDMTDPTNSTITGFGDTSVTPIPFTATADIPSGAFINMHLRHNIKLGFTWEAWVDVDAEIGVYLDLPRVGASIAHMSDVDENCAALATSQSQFKDIAPKVLTDVYQVTPTVDWQVGIAGGSSVLSDFDESFGNGTVKDVPASCLNYDEKSKQYTEAKTVVQKAKNGAAGHLQVAFATYGLAAIGLSASLLL